MTAGSTKWWRSPCGRRSAASARGCSIPTAASSMAASSSASAASPATCTASLRRSDPGYLDRLRAVQNVSAVTAACLVIRKAVFDQVGGLDESLTVAFNDVDFCLKVRAAGYRNVWTPFAEPDPP